MADNQVEYIVRAQDQASAVLNHIASGVGSLSGAAQTLAVAFGPIGAITAGFIAMSTAVGAGSIALADDVEQLDRLSSISGVSVDNLQVMKQVLSEAGGDAEGLPKALVKLNRAIQDGDPMLARIGVTSKDTFGAFMQLAGVITESTDAKARDAVATHLLGKSGAELIPDLEALIKSFDGLHSSMERNGSLLKGDVLDSARQLDTEMDTLSRNWEGAMTRIKSVTVPIVATLTSGFNDMWDAISGANQTPDLANLDRRLVEADTHIRRLQAEANKHGGADWNRNTMAEWVRTAASLREQIAKLKGVDPGVERMRSLHETTKPDALANLGGGSSGIDALAIANRGWFAGKAAQSPTDIVNADIAARAETSRKSLKAMGKTLEELEVPALKVTEAGARAAQRLALVESTLDHLSSSVAGDMSSMAASVLTGTQTIGQAWSQLVQAILSDLATSAAEFGVSLLMNALLPGSGAVSGKITDTFGTAMAPARGGDTYITNVSSIDTKDLVQSQFNGSMRRANDRIRDIARAQSS